jgi:predicted permease
MSRQEEDWRDEIESHLAMRADANAAEGLDPNEAADLARRQFGSPLRTLEDVRSVHVGRWLDHLGRDARMALRGFRRSPGFAAVALATLAIGIGASTAVFSAIDPLLFRPLPYPRGDRLVSVGFSGPIDNNEFQVSNAYMEWRDRQAAFQSMTSMTAGAHPCDLEVGGAQRLNCYNVEANFLSTLGLRPALGREFTREEDRHGAPKTALISYPVWQSVFHGDPGVLNQVVTLEEERVRIIGVLPAGFLMPQLGELDVMLPEQWDERAARNGTIFLRSFARLQDGVSIEQAIERMKPIFQDSLHTVPPELRSEVKLVIRSLRERQIHEVKLASWMLLGASMALLLLACANVANLLLARAAARHKELFIRAAIGAGRGRLAAQMLTESAVLGLAGGAAGCGLAYALLRAFVALAPGGLIRLEHAHIDLRVLGFALAVSLIGAMLFGLGPAFQRRRATTSPMFFRTALVASQIAIAVLLLTGASLFARSLQRLETQPLGFQPERVVTASFTLRRQRYRPQAAQAAFYREIEARLRAIPGGGLFAMSDSIPPRGSHGRPFSNMRIAGRPALPGGGMVAFRYVTPSYFQALGIPIVAGRNFEESERGAAYPPVILSATLARRMFGDENPIGQQIELEADGRYSQVVGVVADAKNAGIDVPPGPEYYRLRLNDATQLGPGAVALFRTSLDTETLSRWIRREFAEVDGSLPVAIQTMEKRVDAWRDRPRFVAWLVGLFAVFGLVLATVGLYGVMSFLVAQRTREIGVRMAIGATPRDIAVLIQKRGLVWTGAGVGVGVIAAVFFTRLVRGLLFEISPQDPVSMATSIVVLAIAAGAAAWVPSYRASRVDPAVTLRCE